MNTGPTPMARQMMPADHIVNSSPNWEGLLRQFQPAPAPDPFDPGDDMKVVLYHFYRTAQGRQIIDWLFDLTARAEFPHVGSTRESAAIAAAKHEARTAVGYSFARAIADGEEIWRKRSPNHEKPA